MRSRRPPPTCTPATTTKVKPDKSTAMLPPAAPRRRSPKSDTCKQAWSVPEQRILERLLSENLDSEKNRYERLFFLAVRENT